MNGFLRLVSVTGALAALAEAKAQARVTNSYEDSLITDYIAAATGAIDGPYGKSGRCFLAQSWDYVCSTTAQRFIVPVPGADTVVSYTYFDADDVSQTLTVGDYFYTVVRDDGISFRLKDGAQLPTANDRQDAVVVRVSKSTENIPVHIKHAALLTVAAWYDDREMGEVPKAAHQLIDIERTGWASA